MGMRKGEQKRRKQVREKREKREGVRKITSKMG
jgi:hypothetical protein